MKNDPLAWAACVQVCNYDCQCTHTYRFAACLSPQDFEFALYVVFLKIFLLEVGVFVS